MITSILTLCLDTAPSPDNGGVSPADARSKSRLSGMGRANFLERPTELRERSLTKSLTYYTRMQLGNNQMKETWGCSMWEEEDPPAL